MKRECGCEWKSSGGEEKKRKRRFKRNSHCCLIFKVVVLITARSYRTERKTFASCHAKKERKTFLEIVCTEMSETIHAILYYCYYSLRMYIHFEYIYEKFSFQLSVYIVYSLGFRFFFIWFIFLWLNFGVVLAVIRN